MAKYPAFSVLGLEIEYMLVNKDTLDIAPYSDALIKNLCGTIKNEAALGDITLSNELVMHVIELKMHNPGLPDAALSLPFQKAVDDLQPILDSMNLRLLPTGAHPWMDPTEETRCWPHDSAEIYALYDRIFNCKGHGWANLQSMHVNLPFANDAEFFTLHSAVRLLIPLLPALTASTPILDGKNTGLNDARLYYYGINQQKIPELSGNLIPEFIHSEADYHEQILQPMYEAIGPWDTEGILQHEWLNSRTAIPKFSRHSLEIRIVDTQECTETHIALALCIHTILKKWCENPDYFLQNNGSMETLKSVYQDAIHRGLRAEVLDPALYTLWQLPDKGNQNLAQIWGNLLERFCLDMDDKHQRILENILLKGNLSDRILHACNGHFERKHMKNIYEKLADCLTYNQFFEAS